MICPPCRKGADLKADQFHKDCSGETQCACQHRSHRWLWHKPPPQVLAPAGIESAEAVGDIGGQ